MLAEITTAQITAAKHLGWSADTYCKKCYNVLVEKRELAYCSSCYHPLNKKQVERLGLE